MKTILPLQRWTGLAVLLGACAGMTRAAPPSPAHRALQFPAGSTGSLAVRDGYGYVLNGWTRGDGVLVFDLKNPEAPRFVNGIPARGYLRAGAFAGDMFYIPATFFSVMVVDVGDPPRIRTLRNLFYNFPAGDVQCLAVSGDRLYLGGRGGGLHILDISDPSAPMPIARYPEFGHLAQIAVAGNRLVMRPKRGEAILAEIDGDRVVEKSRLKLGGSVRLIGPALYETTRRELIVRDLSNLEAPEIAARIPGMAPIGFTAPGRMLMKAPDKTLAVYDVSAPLAPKRVRELSVPEDVTLAASALENGFLYAIDPERISLRSYNIEGDSVRPLGEAFIMRNAGHLALGEGNEAFLSYVHGMNSTVFPLDTRGRGPVDFPTRISQTLPSKDRVFGMHDTHRAAAVARVGSWLLVGDGVCDVSDPRAPRVVEPATRVAADIAVRGGLAGLAQSDRVTFLDVTKLPERVVLSEYRPGNEGDHFVGIALGQESAFLVNAAKGGTRVEVLDIRDPAAPRVTGQCETPAAVRAALYEAEGLLYVPGSVGGGLTILDVSDPASPTLLDTVDGLLDTRSYRIRVHGKRLVYTDSMRGIKVADLENPRAPKLLKTYMGDTTHSASYTDFEIRDNTLFGLRFSHLDIWEME